MTKEAGLAGAAKAYYAHSPIFMEHQTLTSNADIAPKPPRTMKVRIGEVTVSVDRPTPAEIRRNVAVSTDALKRAASRIIRPGVRLPAKKDIPLYSADPNAPGVYIRKLNGKIERGVLTEGTFKVVE